MTAIQTDQYAQEVTGGGVAEVRTLPVWGVVLAVVSAVLGVVAISVGIVWIYQGVTGTDYRTAHLGFFGLIAAALGVFPLFGSIGYMIVKDREWLIWMIILTLPLLAVVALILLTW